VEACRLGYWWYLESWKKDPETFHPHKLLLQIKGKPTYQCICHDL